MFKAANNYDIHDPQTGDIIMECREERFGIITKLLRFTDYKRMTPFDIRIRTPDGKRIVRVTRGISLFLSKVKVLDERDRAVGGLKQKLFSIGGSFKSQKSGRASVRRCLQVLITTYSKYPMVPAGFFG